MSEVDESKRAMFKGAWSGIKNFGRKVGPETEEAVKKDEEAVEDEDQIVDKSNLPSRRDVLKGIVAGAVVSQVGRGETARSQELEVSTQEIIRNIESMSVQEMETVLYDTQPVVPEIAPIADRLREITDVPPGSMIMKTGTSVASGMLESVYGDGINPADIDFGDEQDVLQNVLEHTDFPDGTMDATSMVGADIDTIIHDPMFCRPVGQMDCPPGVSAADAYIDQFDPKISINFIGTNMIRQRRSLEDFAESTEAMIQYYVDNDVIPVLTTIPHPTSETDLTYQDWFEDPEFYMTTRGETEEQAIQDEIDYRSVWRGENAMKYNMLLIKLAEKHQVPIINLQRGAVESAELNGDVPKTDTTKERDPLHFSSRSGEPAPLRVPNQGEKFATGEEAVSYYTVHTLNEIIQEVNQ